MGWLIISGGILAAIYLGSRTRLGQPASAAVVERGIASWYGPGYEGNTTASGERFDKRAMTAAHKKLKFGTVVDVTDTDTGRSVRVRINDRGPYVAGRIIDLTERAAEELGSKKKGLANVTVRVVS